MQLFQINRGKFVSLNQEYRIDYVPYSGGASEWIISRKNSTDAYFTALTSAPTIADAKAKYFEIVKVGA